MLVRKICIMFGIMGSSIASAQYAPTLQDVYHGDSGTVTRIVFPDNQTGYAIRCYSRNTSGTAVSELLKTTDGGASWTSSLSEEHDWREIAFMNANEGSIAYIGEDSSGYDIWVMTTHDGGETWSRVRLPTYWNILGIEYYDESHGLITTSGTYTGFLTSDKGNSWAKSTKRWTPLGSLQFHGKTGYGILTGGTTSVTGTSTISIYKTVDGGSNWDSLPSTYVKSTSDAYTSISFVSDQTGFLVRSSKADSLYKTADGGSTWTRISVNANNYFANGIHFDDANHGFILALDSLRYTTDGGTTWTASPISGLAGSWKVYSYYTGFPDRWIVAGNHDSISWLCSITTTCVPTIARMDLTGGTGIRRSVSGRDRQAIDYSAASQVLNVLQAGTLQIVDVRGRAVHRSTSNSARIVRLEGLATGLYTATLSTQRRSYSRMILVTH